MIGSKRLKEYPNLHLRAAAVFLQKLCLCTGCQNCEMVANDLSKKNFKKKILIVSSTENILLNLKNKVLPKLLAVEVSGVGVISQGLSLKITAAACVHCASNCYKKS